MIYSPIKEDKKNVHGKEFLISECECRPWLFPNASQNVTQKETRKSTPHVVKRGNYQTQFL